MKNLFTLLFVSLMTIGANADGIDYTFNWATSIEGHNAQSANVIGVKAASDGNYFASLVWGSTTAAGKTIAWGGSNLCDTEGAEIEGADYNSGNSYTPNLLFAKIDKTTGNPLWTVYTNFGYVSNDYSSFVATADGGAIVLATIRQSEGADYRLASIVGADGKTTYLQHTDADQWAYRSALIKIDADGKVAWTRTINALDATKDGKVANTPFYTNDLVVDAEGRIYVSGRMCTTLYFTGRSGQIVAKEAVNNDGWTGDSQINCGNAFVAEFDADGYISDVIMLDRDGYTYNQATKMALDGTALYVAGVAVKTGSSDVIPTLTTISLEDNAVKAYKEYEVAANTGGKQNFKIYSLSLIDGSLYMTGNMVGGITDNNVTLTATGTASTLDGYIARLDIDGNLLAGQTFGAVNTGIMGVTEVNGNLFALAYQMVGAGAVALTYDKALSAETSRTTLMTAGTTATAAAPLFDGENVVVMARGAKAASAFYGTTDVKPALTQSFGVLFGSWKVVGGADGISNVKANNGNAADVYNLNGVKMPETDSLDKGVYISNGKKVVKF